MDEQWGWVGNKRHQHWLFYGFDTKRKKVLAHVFGPRNIETLRRLLQLLKKFSIGMAGLSATNFPAQASRRQDFYSAY
jgi:insertion element IS1 protein InsB